MPNELFKAAGPGISNHARRMEIARGDIKEKKAKLDAKREQLSKNSKQFQGGVNYYIELFTRGKNIEAIVEEAASSE